MTTETKPSLLIGIDPGVKTGCAAWDRTSRQFSSVATLTAINAMETVRKLSLFTSGGVEVWFEDARQRKFFGDADKRQKRSGAGIREGVGSVKRDCALWEEFCKHHRIPFRAIKPAAGATKWDAARFAKVTGWQGRTSSHGRDAACLVWGAN